jgi:hypothetical protein
MDRAVSTLLKNVSAASAEEQRGAAFLLGMLLEMNTRPSDELGFYETVLPPDLIRVRLDAEAQAEVLGELARRLSALTVPSAVLWAIGKALPEAAAPVLADLLARQPNLAEDPEAAYQGLIALENCLDYDRQEGRSREAAALFGNEAVVQFLRRAATSSDSQLAEHAPRLLRRLPKAPRGR